MSSKKVKLENPCCCCRSNSDGLFSMIEPNYFNGQFKTYTAIIMECYGIDMKIGNQNIYKDLLVICNICIEYLRQAFRFRHQIQDAYDRINEYVNGDKFIPGKPNRSSAKNELIVDDSSQLDIKNESDPMYENNHSNSTELSHATEKISKIIKVNTEAKKIDFLKCKVCNRMLKSIKSLNRHMEKQHSSYTCEICGKILTSKHAFQKHVSRHEDRKNSHTCDVCKKVIKGNDGLKKHMKIHSILESLADVKRTRKKWIPPVESIPSEGDGENETLFKLDKNNAICKICNENFISDRTLKQHMAVHFPNYICHICSKAFISSTNLRAHIRNHEDVKTAFECGVCNKTVMGACNYKQHMKVHGENALLKYKCPECPERFTNFRRRTQHQIDVHDDVSKIRHCKYCEKGFTSGVNLKKHINSVHLKMKNCACDVCSMMFFSKSQLESHMLCHTGAKDFHCSVCGKSYARKKTLTQHMKIHNNIKNFVCAICDKAFVQKCSLTWHMKSHHKSEERS